MVSNIQFIKPIDRCADMFNGQTRVFFTDGTELILSNGKRGPVLPRRKRAHARKIGAIR
jgi:hypothetical protein